MAMEAMNVGERYEYPRVLETPYHSAGRKAKDEMLQAAERMTESGRRYLGALLHWPGLCRPSRSRGRSRTYDDQVGKMIVVIRAHWVGSVPSASSLRWWEPLRN